jgi:hypothetical protein
MRDILAGCLFRNWASFRVAKTGQLRIPVIPCRLGHFGKIDLGTDFEKTAPNTSAFQGVELGFPTRPSFSGRVGSTAGVATAAVELPGAVPAPGEHARTSDGAPSNSHLGSDVISFSSSVFQVGAAHLVSEFFAGMDSGH